MEWGTMEAVVNKLGGMDGVQRFLSGEIIVKAATLSGFKVWRTIKLGTGLRTADDFRRALKKSNCGIDDRANDILGKSAFTASEIGVDANLVVVSASKLGLKKEAPRADIYARAVELGLSRCPAEVGPQLCRQYTDQPRNERLVIGMEPIADSFGALRLFCVNRYSDGTQWLRAGYDVTHSVGDDDGFVFLAPASSSRTPGLL